MPDAQTQFAGAALLEIGDELLSGKVRDTNGPLLIDDLRELGYPLGEVRVIRDDLAEIARHARELSDRYETVFTSGGVGPTHDDKTLPGLALAFDEPLVLHDRLVDLLQAFYKDDLNESLLRMARLPASAELIELEGLSIPFVKVRNIHVLPGEPTIFAKKWRAIRERFRRAPFHVRRIYTDLDEGALSVWLQEAEARHAVAIGSYPRYDRVDYLVMITIEAKEAAPVEACFAELSASIGEHVLRSE